jgi:hypothetical protein
MLSAPIFRDFDSRCPFALFWRRRTGPGVRSAGNNATRQIIWQIASSRTANFSGGWYNGSNSTQSVYDSEGSGMQAKLIGHCIAAKHPALLRTCFWIGLTGDPMCRWSRASNIGLEVRLHSGSILLHAPQPSLCTCTVIAPPQCVKHAGVITPHY